MRIKIPWIYHSDGNLLPILDILAEPERYRGNYAEIKHRYSPDVVAAGYESLFEDILQKRK